MTAAQRFAGYRRKSAKLLGLLAFAAATCVSPPLAHAQLSPAALAEAIADDARREPELRTFYLARNYQPLWIEGDAPGPAAEELVRLIATADYDGLSRKSLRADRLPRLLRRTDRGDPDDLARAELALSRAFALYVRATRTQATPTMLYQNSLLAPAVPSVAAALSAAAAAPSLERYVAAMAWMHPLYADLRWGSEHFAHDAEALRLIRLNLERVRALPANPAPRYVLIDAAGARLTMYENGVPAQTMRVVVGRPDQPTPMIAGMLSAAVLNPYWNVPPDLVRSRIAANVLGKGLGYLRTGGYQVLSDYSDNPKVLNPAKFDWKAIAAGRREVRVRQLPGRSNFMGKVKFTFPNDLGIYLHDTPDKALMLDDVRQASSGCVRLEDASRLGRWLFGSMPTAPAKAVEQVVPLEQPVPIYITYLTAAPEQGRIVFRNDTYQRDPWQLARLDRLGRRAR